MDFPCNKNEFSPDPSTRFTPVIKTLRDVNLRVEGSGVHMYITSHNIQSAMKLMPFIIIGYHSVMKGNLHARCCL